MTRLILFFALLFLSGCASTGTALLNSLAKSDYKKTSDVSYGLHSENKLDIYRPISTTKSGVKGKVIVFFYGGCWGDCTSLKKSDYLFVGQSLASKGFTVVIADFRQYPEVNFNDLMSDTTKAVQWVSRNIASYGGNPNNIFIAGHSSGAHIAATLAFNPRYLDRATHNRIKGFIGLAGPYDFLPLDEEYQRKLFNPVQNYANSQPINFVSSSSPPLLILHGEEDTTVLKHNAINLSKKAQKLGVEQELILYPKLSHVGILTALSRPFQGRSTVLNDIVRFVNAH